ncbi:MAG: hypothetical protein OCD76_17815 [Reichenbachiella sp.]
MRRNYSYIVVLFLIAIISQACIFSNEETSEPDLTSDILQRESQDCPDTTGLGLKTSHFDGTAVSYTQTYKVNASAFLYDLTGTFKHREDYSFNIESNNSNGSFSQPYYFSSAKNIEEGFYIIKTSVTIEGQEEMLSYDCIFYDVDETTPSP